MRIALFLLTNLAVMVVFGLVLSLTGIQSSSVQGLLIIGAAVWFWWLVHLPADVEVDGTEIGGW